MKTSVTFSEDEKSGMIDQYNAILARHITALEYPLEPNDTLKLWDASLSPTERAGVDAMLTMQMADGFVFPIVQKKIYLPMTLNGGRVMFAATAGPLIQLGCIPWERMPKVRLTAVEVLGPEKGAAFDAWATQSTHVVEIVDRSKDLLAILIRMSSTVGQLFRMAPDLVKYAYTSTRKAFESQVRRSPFPSGWERVNRLELQRTLDHLAFCYLLPEAPSVQRTPRAATDEMHQRIFYSGAPNSPYRFTSSPDWTYLSKYELPVSGNPMQLGKFVDSE